MCLPMKNVIDIPLFVYIHTIDIRLDNIVMPLARQVGRADRASISGSKFSHHSALCISQRSLTLDHFKQHIILPSSNRDRDSKHTTIVRLNSPSSQSVADPVCTFMHHDVGAKSKDDDRKQSEIPARAGEEQDVGRGTNKKCGPP